jgi:DNA-binding CsgD family transcriptional regulator
VENRRDSRIVGSDTAPTLTEEVISPAVVEHGREDVVGRDTELAALDVFLEPAAPVPAALVIAGEAGIGKTTVVRIALAWAASAGLRILYARPAEGEAELPYVGLADLLAPVGAETIARLARPQREALAAALAREGSSAAVDEHALSRGLFELLRVEAAPRDLLVVIDDVQWLDRPTARALGFALRRAGALPLRVLVAARSEGAAPMPPFGLEQWERVGVVALRGLSATELGALIRQRIGVQLPRPRLKELERTSGGNPMFAVELTRSSAGPASQPTSLTRALQERIVGLDPTARDAARVAASALRPSPALLLSAGVARLGLETVLTAGILQLQGERLVFTHPLLASAAYETLLPDDRRRVHARLAAASTDPVERGHHLARSAEGLDEVAAGLLEQAADEAAALGDHAGAATFLLRAAELSSDSVDAELRAVEELKLAGDVGRAGARAAALVARLPPGAERAIARNQLVGCSIGSTMSYDDGLAELEVAVADATGDAATEAVMRLQMAEIMLGTCSLDGALAHSHRASELAEQAGASALAVQSLAVIGFTESMLGYGVTPAARRAVELWDGTMSTVIPPRTSLACACIAALAFDEAAHLLEEELLFAAEHGLEQLEVVARLHLAEAQLRAGRWSDALRNAGAGVEHARQASEAQAVTGGSCTLAMTLASVGEHEEARAMSHEALVSAEATNDFWWTISNRAVLGQIALTEDDPYRAVELLEPAFALMLERGLGDLSLFPVAQSLGEALVATSRVDDALAVVAALRSCRAGENAWCRAMAARCEALVASARGDYAAARVAFATALDAHAEFVEPFEYARTLLLLGRAERSARSWGAARAAFADALESFDALGAARWSERAAADLTRLPGRRPADGTALSLREREVAELAAAGLANKEIAARLYLSVSTVETNLSKAYSKLGVRSRAELVTHLPRDVSD